MLAEYYPIVILQTTDWSNSSVTKFVGQFFSMILIFIVVAFMAYYVTKWVASSKNVKKSGNLELIESMSAGVQGAIQIIRVGQKYFLVGITKEKISFLTEIDKEEIQIQSGQYAVGFEKYFKKYINKLKNNSEIDPDENAAMEDKELEEDIPSGQNSNKDSGFGNKSE